jgi:hypothetical protein
MTAKMLRDGSMIYSLNESGTNDIYAGVYTTAMTNESRSAVARRLQACWNACDGIPTEGLEIGLPDSAVSIANAERLQDELKGATDMLLMVEENWKDETARVVKLTAELDAVCGEIRAFDSDLTRAVEDSARLTKQRDELLAVLEGIKGLKDNTFLGNSDEYQSGATEAFNLCAGLAAGAIAKCGEIK